MYQLQLDLGKTRFIHLTIQILWINNIWHISFNDISFHFDGL